MWGRTGGEPGLTRSRAWRSMPQSAEYGSGASRSSDDIRSLACARMLPNTTKSVESGTVSHEL